MGRDAELRQIRRLLRVTRLVTLTGMGGVGKTRLALRAAGDFERAFRDGVWLVELAELNDPSLLVEAIGDALDIQDESSDPPADVLSAYLRDKQLLLVIDNCEHLVAPCARLLDGLLAACEELHVLVTSRQSLRIASEHVVTVGPLAVPRPEARSSDECPAVRLFVDRAAAVVSPFPIRTEDYQVISRICRRLDGVPLAIELAAAKVRVLSLEQILHRLDDRFRLLTGGYLAALPRYRTLATTVDWSYELCTASERAIWARLSVFAGEFDLEAAEAVCACDIDLMTGLVEKSILFWADDSARYRMPETIREYGRRKLSGSAEKATLRRHAEYFLRLSEQAAAEWLSPRQLPWCDRLRATRADFKLALEFLLGDGNDAEAALGLLTSLWNYWCACGLAKEASNWFGRVLPLVDSAASRAEALPTAAFAAILTGDHTVAAALVDESLAICGIPGREAQLAWAMRSAAWLAVVREDYRSGVALCEEALARFRSLGDEPGTTVALGEVAFVYWLRGDDRRGDIDLATDLALECLSRSERQGESWCRSFALCIYGLCLWCRSRYPEADELLRRSLRLKQELHDLLGIAICLDALGWIAVEAHKYKRAATIFGAAAAVRHKTGLRLTGSTRLLYYGERAREQARRALGSAAYRNCFGRGLELAVGQAVEHAVGGASVSSTAGAAHQGDGIAELTSRERSVAALVAQGCTNKEIAARLVVSIRTAEGHVERIRTKLNCTSRAQIAARILGVDRD